jgi:phosphoserine phosphatase
MQHVITLIAQDGNIVPINDIVSMIEREGIKMRDSGWITRGEAYDIYVDGEVPETLKRLLEMRAHESKADLAVQPVNGREKKLLISDMDSTMIRQECIDELADMVGIKEKVAAITERAMRGDIEFEDALKERVALLKGVTVAQMQQVFDERIKLMPGARALVKTMRKRGAYTVLVSGGFSFFTARVANAIGFDTEEANVLMLQNETLTGEVREPVLGKESKRDALLNFCKERKVSPDLTIAVGDGANDALMVEAAGMGVAYHAKPRLQKAAKVRIRFCDLRALLYIQGIPRSDWAVG